MTRKENAARLMDVAARHNVVYTPYSDTFADRRYAIVTDLGSHDGRGHISWQGSATAFDQYSVGAVLGVFDLDEGRWIR